MTFHTKHSKSEKKFRICFDKIDEFILKFMIKLFDFLIVIVTNYLIR